MMEKELLELLSERIKKFVKICKGSHMYPAGFILLERKDLRTVDAVYLTILGRKCAYHLGLTKRDTISPKEIYETLRRQVKVSPSGISMSLTSLVRRGYVSRVGKGEYAVVVPKVEEYLETLEFAYNHE